MTERGARAQDKRVLMRQGVIVNVLYIDYGKVLDT
jgi:hypothetical protein